MKIYLVSAGDYSAYGIDALFSSYDKAQAFIDEVCGERIEEYELDPPNVDMKRKGYKLWFITMKRDGSVLCCNDQSFRGDLVDTSGELEINDSCSGKYRDIAYARLWAKSEEHAIKIVNEKRAQMIAMGKWESE